MAARRVLAPPGAPPPWLMLHTANILRAAEISAFGRNAATVRWFPREEEGTRLTMAHFNKGGPTYDDAPSRLGHLQGLLQLHTDRAAALRRELDGHDGLRLGWEAVADGACCPSSCTPPHRPSHPYGDRLGGHPPGVLWDDLIAAFHDHGVLPGDTWQAVPQGVLNRDYQSHVRTLPLEL